MYISKKVMQLLSVFIGLICYCTSAREMPPANVNVIEAKIRTLQPVIWVTGTVVSRNNANLSAEVSGRIIYLTPLGTELKKGDVIAKIDVKTLKIQQQQEKSKVSNAKVKLRFLASEVKRIKELVSKKLSAETELDKIETDHEIAGGNLIAAQAQLANIEQQLSFSELQAPFDGIVAERLSNLGEYVENGTDIVRFVETEYIEASIFAPIAAFQFVSKSEPISIKSVFGESQVSIKSIVPVADMRSHLIELRLDMSSLNWPIGASIKAGVSNGGAKEALTVPRDAMVLRRQGAYIIRINKDNVAEKVNVDIGLAVGDFVELLTQGEVQLKEGDKIVIRGAERIQPGQKVAIKSNNDALISSNHSEKESTAQQGIK